MKKSFFSYFYKLFLKIWSNKFIRYVLMFYYYILIINIPILTIYLKYVNTNKYCSISFDRISFTEGTLLSTQTTPGIHHCSIIDHFLWWPIWFFIFSLVFLFIVFLMFLFCYAMVFSLIIPLYTLMYFFNLIFKGNDRIVNPYKFLKGIM